jgi:RNA polymerase sigma factor (sigma-70 family)
MSSAAMAEILQGATLPPSVSALHSNVETGEYDDGLSVFVSMRPRLFRIAYRMLGSAAEADDIMQDVWLRWQSTNRSAVENPPAYLAKTATRLCINLAQSAYSRRESCIGTWLPEPVDTNSDPGSGAERGKALKLAVMLLLERLSPTERAAYVLREAFDYSYRQIADVLHLGEANTRQLVFRARKHLVNARCTTVRSSDQRRFLQAFITAAQTGELHALEGLFAADISSSATSSELKTAEHGRASSCKRAATLVAAIASSFWKTDSLETAQSHDCVLPT